MKKAYEQIQMLMITFEKDVVTSSGTGQQVYENDNVVTWFGISED